MSAAIPVAHFDRKKPFYPLVMQYAIQLVGFKELGARGTHGLPEITEAIQRLRGRDAERTFALESIEADLSELLGPLELASSARGDTIQIATNDIAKELAANHEFLIDFLLLPAGSVVVLAHELCKYKPAHDTGPLWEFLRHCRNAAGHGGRFNFLHGEPKRLAKWTGLEIHANLKGTPLFKDVDGNGFLSPANPILLLWDIEQAYPSLA
jgi:hypothetical protein